MYNKICGVRKAFTLVELIVSLTITLLLAAILFPAFSQIRETARASTCQSNLKQIGLAFIMYSQDYDERLPCGLISEPSPYLGRGWVTQLIPYTGNYTIFKCPSDTSVQLKPSVSVSYSFNGNMVRDFTNSNLFSLQPLASIIAPSRTVLCSEVRYGRYNPTLQSDTSSPVTNGITLWGAGQGSGDKSLQFATGIFSNSSIDHQNSNNRDLNGQPYKPAHNGFSHYLAFDGHVKSLKSSRVSAGASATHLNVPQTSALAESIDYAGINSHQLTFSHY